MCSHVKLYEGTGGDQYLKCSCGLSVLSGLPCSHELWIHNKLSLPKTTLKIRPRWFLKFEERVKQKLY